MKKLKLNLLSQKDPQRRRESSSTFLFSYLADYSVQNS